VLRSRILLILVLALAGALLVPQPSGAPALADTVVVDDAADNSLPHHIGTVVVDNTGDMVGAVVRHRGLDWTGSVELRFDVGTPTGADYVAVIHRGTGQANRFETAGGLPWLCEGLVASSVNPGRLTRLTAPRSCFGSAATMVVEALSSAGDDVDTAISPVVRQQTRPNVVMIMVDDMRDDDLAYMPLTQQLIGDQGVRFANSLSQYPLCCPARASVLTGQYAHNHRVWSHEPPWGFSSFDDKSTLATWLQDAGYSTTYVGKYLNGYGWQPEPGKTTGTSVTYVPPGWDDWRASLDGGLDPAHPDDGGTYRYMDTTLADNGVDFDSYAGRYQTRVYGELSEQIVTEQAASDSPFFYYVSYTAPHNGTPVDPDDPGPVTNDKGRTSTIKSPYVPADVRGLFDSVITEAPGASWFRASLPRNKPEYLRGLRPMNDAEKAALLEVTRQRAEALSVVDQQVARMIRALAATGELEETLVMLTSDNGYFLGEQGIRAGKTLPHDPSLHTPLLMRGPGIPAGEVRYDPFLSIDFAPTITQLTGVQAGLPMDGTSMLDVARFGDRGWSRAVLTETGRRGIVRDTDEGGGPLPTDDPGAADIRYAIGVRSDRYLYTHLANGDEELYDMAVDPDQYDNLIDVPAYARVRELMREQLAKIRACDAAQCRVLLPPKLRSDPGQSVLNPG
jgi:arylsulfatase A-like enzyme